MKQLRIVGILCLLISSQSFYNSIFGQDASTTSSGEFIYGVHLGITGSQFSDEQPHRSIIADYTGGIQGKYLFSESFGLQAELNYFEHGGRLLRITTADQLNTIPLFNTKTEDLKVSIRSLELPLMANYALIVGPTKINLLLGPSIEWVMHAGNSIQTTALYPSSPSVFTTFSDEENITNEISRFIYNAAGGVSLEVPFVSETSLYLDIRYRYSINQVYKGYSYLGIAGTGASLRQHSISLNLGLNF